MPLPTEFLSSEKIYRSRGEPMRLPEALTLLERIEERDQTVFSVITSGGERFEQIVNANRFTGIEWGIARENTFMNPECVLVAGDTDRTSWALIDKVGWIPLAHSHPYHDIANASRCIKLNENNEGVVRWIDISGQSGTQNYEERTRIFPSSSDIEFCASRGLYQHIVMTPYVVLGNPRNQQSLWIMNYDTRNGIYETAPRLHFVITGARRLGSVCTATLQAYRAHAPTQRTRHSTFRQHQMFWHKRNVLTSSVAEISIGSGGMLIL